MMRRMISKITKIILSTRAAISSTFFIFGFFFINKPPCISTIMNVVIESSIHYFTNSSFMIESLDLEIYLEKGYRL